MNSFGFDGISIDPRVLMEDSSPLVLEISSDEEVGFGGTRKGGGEFLDRDDCDWLSELFREVGGNKDDDVVLVSETFANPPKKPRLEEPLRLCAKVVGDDGDDDDDDCVVLDGDPDKPAVVENGKVDDGGGGSGGGDDDVEIVAEKGEVACRDFPHARHLCAKFLFASTHHEVHCTQCHCYVCDSLAPCSQWGNGLSSIDHCHATDKDEYWRSERKRMKKGDKNPLPAMPSIQNTSLLTAFFQPTQALGPPRPNSINLGLRPVTVHLPSNVSVPNPINQGQAHPSGCAGPVYRPQPLLAPTNNIVAGNRSHILKRPGSVGASPVNSNPYGSQLSRVSRRRCRLLSSHAMNKLHGSNHRNLANRKLPSPSSIINVGHANYVPSHRQIPSRPYSNGMIRGPIQCQSQTNSQPYVNNSSFVSAVPLQPKEASQPSVENLTNLISAPVPHVFRPHNNAFGNEVHPRFSIHSDRNMSNNLENQTSQPRSQSNPFFDVLNDIDQGLVWDLPLTNGNVQMHGEISQCQSTTPTDNPHLQSVAKNDQRQSTELVNHFQQQSVVQANNHNSSLTNGVCQFPESIMPDTLDFQLDSWMFENHSLPGGLEGPVSPLWNAFSPEPASVDTGNLFDF